MDPQHNKTKSQLIEDIEVLHKRVVELEKSETPLKLTEAEKKNEDPEDKLKDTLL